MKNKIKFISIILIVLFVLLNFCPSLATNSVTINEEKNGITKINEEDLKFDKKIKSINGNKVNIELTLSMYPKDIISSNSEIVFLLDSSSSMNTQFQDTTRKNNVGTITKKLAKKIYNNNKNVKIGAVKFSGNIEKICDTTNDISKLNSAIDEKYINIAPNGDTNIYQGLVSTKGLFNSKTRNKIIILLTDGLPSDSSTYDATIKELKDTNYYIISVLVGLGSDEQKIVNQIFGTEENPTSDKFYNILDDELENKVTNNVYNNVVDNTVEYGSNVKVIDTFPEDIFNNFNITINSKSNKSGETKELKNNEINWNINKIMAGESYSLDYSLELKDNYDKEINNKVLNTNKNVKISLVNDMNENKEYISKDNPQIKLVKEESLEIKQEVKNETKVTSAKIENKTIVDNTTSNKIVPKTGVNTMIIFTILSVILIAICIKLQLNKYKDI